MSMHAKTDSEVTSLAPSSPSRSQRGHVYYVQSPSHDAATASFHSSPAASPSRHSSSTRFSGSSSARKAVVSGRKVKEEGEKVGWRAFDSIEEEEEEGLLDDDDGRGMARRLYAVVAFVLGFFLLFSPFALVLWGASRNQKPLVTMKSILFNDFVIQAGNDNSGVATVMVTMNSTLKLTYRNSGTFFGVHVTSSLIDVAYTELSLASGAIERFYQSRKSQRLVTVTLQGSETPLYGGGADLSGKNGVRVLPVPLDLNFTVMSKAYVLGKLVKPKFYNRIYCSVIMDPKKMNVALSLKKNCTYL